MSRAVRYGDFGTMPIALGRTSGWLFQRAQTLRLEGVNPGDGRPDDQRMDVVGTLVGLDRFQIHHVAHDGVVVGDAVGAEDVAREPCALQRHPDVVPLSHRDVVMLGLAFVFEAADLQYQKLAPW